MKLQVVKACLFFFAFALFLQHANAQRRSNNRNNTGTSNPSSTGAPTQQNNNPRPTNFSAYGNLKVEVDSSGAGSSTGAGKSMRPDNAFGFKDSILNERTPLPYEFLRLDDALYAETVWRE